MAKNRLNQSHRDALVALADKVVSTPGETLSRTTAYLSAYAAVVAVVEARYPAKDMAVLKRYSVAGEDWCISLKADLSLQVQFRIKPDDKAPLAPQVHCCSRVHLVERDTIDLVDAYNEAVTAENNAHREKMRDYRSVIKASRYFEDVIEIWPEAEALRDKICQPNTALTTISPELIGRIKADVQARAS